jgi:hypothetical protein
MFKSLLVYSHLISACLAIGVIFIQDAALIKWRGRAMDEQAINSLKRDANLIITALILLWISGMALVIQGQMDNPAYLLNQKLWAKFTVVGILTLNGLVLHAYSFPLLISPKGFLGSGIQGQLFVLVTAVISLVSWFFSCYLGIARAWNNVAPYTYVMTVYTVILSITMIGALLYLRYWHTGKLPFINKSAKSSAY